MEKIGQTKLNDSNLNRKSNKYLTKEIIKTEI